HLAAAPRASGAGRQLCLRQSGDRGAAGRLAGRRALRRARHRRDGRGAAGRGGDHLREGGPGDAGARRGSQAVSPVALDRRGLWIAVGAFVIWGLMPLYWHLLREVPSLQIVLHRAVWCAVLVATWLTLREGHGWFRAVVSQPRLAGMLALSGTLIAFNWGLYVWAVNAGHVIEASLGYFINPLLNVLIGVSFLRGRLSRPQWIAVALAGGGVAWLSARYGSFPWIALCLAGSFALYGVIRKFAAVEAVRGLGVENMFMFVPALALLAWIELGGNGGFFSLRWGGWTDALLVLGGALTAIPLIF